MNLQKVDDQTFYVGPTNVSFTFTKDPNTKQSVLFLDGIEIPHREAKKFVNFERGIVDTQKAADFIKGYKLATALLYVITYENLYSTIQLSALIYGRCKVKPIVIGVKQQY